MKPRVVYALTAFVGIISAVLLSLIRIILGPPYLVWQLGLFIPDLLVQYSQVDCWYQCIFVPQYHSVKEEISKQLTVEWQR